MRLRRALADWGARSRSLSKGASFFVSPSVAMPRATGVPLKRGGSGISRPAAEVFFGARSRLDQSTKHRSVFKEGDEIQILGLN